MEILQELRIKTHCEKCVNKCCSQPYDWVYLTSAEIAALEEASGLKKSEFVTPRDNPHTGHKFRSLNLPCRFLDVATGQCTVYESRPLICRIFPFYPEPLTGDAALLPVQCGENLEILPLDSGGGWCLDDVEEEIKRWLSQLWSEAMAQEALIARTEGSP